MRIGISAEYPSLDAKVGDRFGTSEYLLIVDSDTGEMEAIVNPGASSPSHSGIQAVILAISRKLDALLTGYLSPTAEKHLTSNGIRVVRGLAGSVSEVLDRYTKDLLEAHSGPEMKTAGPLEDYRDRLINAAKSAARQFGGTIPPMVGVIMLVGLLHVLVEKDGIALLFTGNDFWDALRGAIAGSILAGNAISSYVVGGELLERGVDLFAVTAFMVAWVTVGLLQMPAEMAALGKRFALIRNGLSFFASLCIAAITVVAWQLFFGGCP